MLTDTTTVTATPDLAVVELDGEAVVLSPSTGTYYGLNEVGARALELAREPATTAAIVAALLEEYDVPQPVLHADVLAFLSDMAEAGLVALDADPASHEVA